MEQAAGRDRFDAFLRGYFDAHAFQPMTSDRFVAYLDAELIRGDDALRARIRPQEWIDAPGLPDNAPRVVSEAFARVRTQSAAFADGTAPDALPTAGWSTHEWVHFLQSLPAQLSDAQLAALDDAFGFGATGNTEIRFAWLRVAIRNEYRPAVPSLEGFLTEQGRRKFVLPLFTDLMASDWGRPLAQRIYRAARPGYHSVTTGSVDAVVGVPSGG
jgi:hypothetical protein